MPKGVEYVKLDSREAGCRQLMPPSGTVAVPCVAMTEFLQFAADMALKNVTVQACLFCGGVKVSVGM